MATTIKLKNGSGAPLAADLVQGEPAFDLTNKRLYTENASGTVIEIGTSPSTIDINAGTIDGTVIGGASAAAGTFTTLNATGGGALTGTWSDLGSVTTVDINGGTIDGVTIGGASAGAGTFTTLTTGSTVTLNGGTANGVLYLNGSKVATSGSALTFDGTTATINTDTNNTGLVVEASTTTSSQVNIGIGVLTAGRPFVGTNTSTNPLEIGTRAAADTVFVVNSSEQMRLTSTGLGIGTTSPGVKLSVDSGATQEYANFNSTAASGGYLTLTRSGANGIIIGNYAAASGGGSTINADALFFRTPNGIGFGSGGASVTAFMDASGNLGLGVTPSAWETGWKGFEFKAAGNGLFSGGNADVRLTSGAYYNAGWKYGVGGSAVSYYFQGAGAHSWYTAASGTAGNAISFTQAMTLDASGNLGIGTTSPVVRLQLNGSDTTSGVYIQKAGAAQSFFGAESSWLGTGASANTVVASYGSTDILFGIGGVEKARINSSGNVGIGTSSPSGPLHIKSGSSPKLVLEDTSSATTSYIDGVAGFLLFGGGGSERMRIDSSGNLLVGGTATPTSSAKNIVLYNGTAPTGNATDGVILYAEDVSASSELKVRDEAGNVTTLSPHNFDLIPEGPSEDMAWSYYSERDGKRINVDMLKAIRLLEQLTGEKLVHTN